VIEKKKGKEKKLTVREKVDPRKKEMTKNDTIPNKA
jgi:hypothetical protein